VSAAEYTTVAALSSARSESKRDSSDSHIEVIEALTSPAVLLSVLCAVLWIYAGLQTWRLMFLIDPDAGNCELDLAMKRGDMPQVIFVLFILLWPFLLLYTAIRDLVDGMQPGSK
jgi:hypothetical protein